MFLQSIRGGVMKRISAIGVFSGLLLIAAAVALMYLTIMRPAPDKLVDQNSGTVTPEAEIGESPTAPDLLLPEPTLPPPDTGRIAFVSDRDGNQEIYTMKPDGSEVVR